MKKFVSLLAFIIAVFCCRASEPFNGMLFDVAGKPLKKARIYVSDPKKYAVTDGKGRFGLTDVQPTDTLCIRLHKKKEVYRVAVDGRTGMRIYLADEGEVSSAQDDELVAFGYGFVKRREFTGASNGISGDELRRSGQTNILAALRGKVAGLQISGGNAPWGGGSAVIRGQSSINLSSEPLYIVDGAQVASLDMININDVEHVEVLKDASIYGNRGANGAILVFTKRGASGLQKSPTL